MGAGTMPFFLSRLGERCMKMRKTILLPASVGIAMLLACAVALLAALASAPTASAASFEHGASFAVRCDFSHRKQVDPVVSPAAPRPTCTISSATQPPTPPPPTAG